MKSVNLRTKIAIAVLSVAVAAAVATSRIVSKTLSPAFEVGTCMSLSIPLRDGSTMPGYGMVLSQDLTEKRYHVLIVTLAGAQEFSVPYDELENATVNQVDCNTLEPVNEE